MAIITPTASRSAGLIPVVAVTITTVAVAMIIVSALTSTARGEQPATASEAAIIALVIGAVSLTTLLTVPRWALAGSDRRAHAVIWTALAIGAAVSPFLFWTFAPAIAGGVALTVGWTRRERSRGYLVAAVIGAALIVLDVVGYVASM